MKNKRPIQLDDMTHGSVLFCGLGCMASIIFGWMALGFLIGLFFFWKFYL